MTTEKCPYTNVQAVPKVVINHQVHAAVVTHRCCLEKGHAAKKPIEQGFSSVCVCGCGYQFQGWS